MSRPEAVSSGVVGHALTRSCVQLESDARRQKWTFARVTTSSPTSSNAIRVARKRETDRKIGQKF